MPVTHSDRFTDSLDREWSAGAPLGRGSWGKTRVVRDDKGREAVLKEPLTDDDFPADAPLPDDLVAACRDAATEQAALLEKAEHPWLPRLEATADLGGGRLGLVLPRYQTLQQRLEANRLPMVDALGVVVVVARKLSHAGLAHGNLRPSNILVNDRGEPVLADRVTPALATHGVRLAELSGARGWLPPEAEGAPDPLWDTWALGQILHTVAMAPPPDADEGRPPRPALPHDGLDKLALATLKDRVMARLGREGTNPRFRSRLAERLAALLNRALSAAHEPSPPYRFADPAELADRASEVAALARPAVEDVGRLLLPAAAQDGVFQGGAPVGFTVSVGCTPGVDDHEDLVCGLQLVDLDAEDEGRVAIEEASFDVDRHPSGRLRYKFGIPGVGPGRYEVRVAFSIKDSGDTPETAAGEFEVRPPPGYVPPSEQPPPNKPIDLGAHQPASDHGDPSVADDPSPGTAVDEVPPTPDEVHEPPSEAGSGPGGELIEGVFPRPLAPPEDDEPEPEPEPEPRPEPLAPPAAAGPVAVPTPPPSEPDETGASEGGDEAAPPSETPSPAPAPVAAPPPGPSEPAPFPSSGAHTATVAQDPPASTPATGAPPPPPPVTTATVDEPVERDFFLPDEPGLDDVEFHPDAGEDLPTWETDGEGGGLPPALQRVLDMLRRDTYIAVGAAVAASLVLVLALTALLKAC